MNDREQKAVEQSWAKVFADGIFPFIDEKRFSVLYSDRAFRPNVPINVIIGGLIIMKLFDYSDDEIVENLMLDLHLQYALHMTSFEDQLLSDKTFSRFWKRCYDYERIPQCRPLPWLCEGSWPEDCQNDGHKPSD